MDSVYSVFSDYFPINLLVYEILFDEDELCIRSSVYILCICLKVLSIVKKKSIDRFNVNFVLISNIQKKIQKK